ncbi:MAG: hypothetical protein ABSH14_12675 [Verrucomicrobiia bacterium]
MSATCRALTPAMGKPTMGSMQKVLIVVGVGAVVFGILFIFLWRITGPVFNAMPEMNGLLLVISVGIPVVLTAGVMRLVWAICSGTRWWKRR